MNRTVALIPTRNRPEELLDLLGDIPRGVPVLVVDDASEADYGAVAAELQARPRSSYCRTSVQRGRDGFWETILDLATRGREVARWALFLADDFRLAGCALERGHELLVDAGAAGINLLRELDRGGRPQWNVVCDGAHGPGWMTSGWIDGAALVDLDALLPLLPRSRPRTTMRSSGVWTHVTREAAAAGVRFIEPTQSLAVHRALPSQMHGLERAAHPLLAADFVEGPERARRLAFDDAPFVACVATIPERAANLPDVLDALVPQVDQVHVILSGYPTPPLDLVAYAMRDTRIALHTAQREPLRDLAKFLPLFGGRPRAGYVFTLDDDLVVREPHYTQRLAASCRALGDAALVGLHAWTRLAHVSPHRGELRGMLRTPCYRARATFDRVHMLGTGAFAAPTQVLARLLAPGLDAPTWGGFADGLVALRALEADVPLYAVPHSGRWLERIDEGGVALWHDNFAPEGLQRMARFWNAHDWPVIRRPDETHASVRRLPQLAPGWFTPGRPTQQ